MNSESFAIDLNPCMFFHKTVKTGYIPADC
jgi:hypothetical protein